MEAWIITSKIGEARSERARKQLQELGYEVETILSSSHFAIAISVEREERISLESYVEEKSNPDLIVTDGTALKRSKSPKRSTDFTRPIEWAKENNIPVYSFWKLKVWHWIKTNLFFF